MGYSMGRQESWSLIRMELFPSNLWPVISDAVVSPFAKNVSYERIKLRPFLTVHLFPHTYFDAIEQISLHFVFCDLKHIYGRI
jgi:hypothetical protein